MLRFTVRHELHCTPARFWEVFLDPAYSRALLVDHMQYRAVEIGPLVQRGELQHRHTEAIPKLDLPGPVARLIDSRMRYIEDGTYDPAAGQWTYAIELAGSKKLLQQRGQLTVEPHGDGHCLRSVDIRVESGVFGLGGAVERSAKANLETGWEEGARFTNAWVERHPSG